MNPEAKKKVAMRTFSTNDRRSGFTLIELLVVVALITLLAGAAGGYYVRTHSRLAVASCVRQLALATRYARIVAVETGAGVDLVLDKTSGSFCLRRYVFNEETSEKHEVIIRNQYSRPVTFPDNIKFESLWKITLIGSAVPEIDDENIDIVSFYPNGTSDTLIAQIGDGENHYTLTLFSAGRGARVKFGLAENIKLPIVDLDMQNE